jgi:hypothetical protein
VGLVGLQDLLHQTLGYLVLRPGHSFLKDDAFYVKLTFETTRLFHYLMQR